ncbi:MAG: hypothetical protein QN174_12265 [Armatimonadota bacterium]|nr:hypothetical protein [Armatimonadota bacterium]MDR7423547.1 hypothetical protein [Armatimonadota bacterium]MDR7454670.1 hypothetical protein [Armatimonadota bacterium]MDR7456590.1 hypothetical protein [Armatimonadota bacterium]MDR7497719.1 hypothetical protein [Armatimonadota bacterium]
MRPIFLAVCLVLTATSPLSAAPTDETADIAKNLAENILGRGQVRSSRSTNGGRGLVMAWESPTYRSHHAAAHTRELLEAEVGLAWGAIWRVLHRVEALEFEITSGGRRLCSGTATRTRPLVIVYARDLGN